MSKQYPYRVGDIILNQKANILYCIVEITRAYIYLRCENEENQRTFSMRKFQFKEQLEGEKGREILKYFPVVKK